jgi:hypothetical protein
MLHTSPDSKWNKTIAPFLEKSTRLRLNAWGVHASKESEAALDPLVKWVSDNFPTAKDTYPQVWGLERHLLRAVHQTFLSAAMSDEFAEQFRGMGKQELEECARSFHFDECEQREGLNKILREHAKNQRKAGEWEEPPELKEGEADKLEAEL